ncbi:MAG: hypothetical protein KAG61_07340 [Bacteriovoracaceae bacterium]|nr:hypothetical protein [Bacteriovoracaceae bacterium]
MNKNRFKKKQILGYILSYHACRRQVEREVTDEVLTKILQYGKYDTSNPESTVLTLDGYRLYLSHDEETIITVTAPDRIPFCPKTLSRDAGKLIKEKIEDEDSLEKEDQKLTFEGYMRNWKK